MSTLREVLNWNEAKWESKNQKMYSSGNQNTWAWFNEELDQDVVTFLADQPGDITDVLDLGTCSGTQAIGLAELGYSVIGSDVSRTALSRAEASIQVSEKAKARLRFVYDDIIDSKFEDDRFDLILDRGCYHSICYFSHRAYVLQIKRVLRPGGTLLLKTMSSKEERFSAIEVIDGKPVPMPYKFTAEKLSEVFASDFDIVHIKDSFFYSSVLERPARAILSVLRNPA